MKKNILVFPCGSEIALDIYSSVKNSTYFNLIGANSVEDHGKFVYDDYIGDVPYVYENNFIPFLREIVRIRNIDAIYPTMDTVIAKCKSHESELGCRIISSPLVTTEICLSKKLTYEKLKDIISVPKIYDPVDVPMGAFPVFAKPIVGYSGRGTKKLNNQREVDLFFEGKNDLMLLEFLPGEEFTVDCFTDKNGHLLYSGARKRNRTNNGISVNTFFVEDQSEFEKIARSINSLLRFRGAWFYQVKRNAEGKLVLLEIASRLGGSSLLSRSIGVNLALLTLFDAFDYTVSVFKNKYTSILDRALTSRYKVDLEFDSVYCDYDDCLILNNSTVNVDLLRFLYRCLNEKKTLYLLTKHQKTDLIEELKRYRLFGVFDEIIHITSDQEKYKYIKSNNPIFIDDSNSERYNVFIKLGIPVFSPEMLDIFS